MRGALVDTRGSADTRDVRIPTFSITTEDIRAALAPYLKADGGEAAEQGQEQAAERKPGVLVWLIVVAAALSLGGESSPRSSDG